MSSWTLMPRDAVYSSRARLASRAVVHPYVPRRARTRVVGGRVEAVVAPVPFHLWPVATQWSHRECQWHIWQQNHEEVESIEVEETSLSQKVCLHPMPTLPDCVLNWPPLRKDTFSFFGKARLQRSRFPCILQVISCSQHPRLGKTVMHRAPVVHSRDPWLSALVCATPRRNA